MPCKAPSACRRYAISTGERVLKVDTELAPLQRWIGGLGMPGWTAYFGLLEVGQPKAGETVVVSAASGAVGSVVGQIAKIKGCRAVGIAGGPAKCRYVTQELGFDACIDYKAGNLGPALKDACPKGIDVNFENVGGEVLDAVLLQMNVFGRIALCGLISGYNATEAPEGPKNIRAVLTQRLKMQGLIVSDWAARIPEAVAQLGLWHKEGKLKIREDVREGGLDAFPDVLNLLYTGGNHWQAGAEGLDAARRRSRSISSATARRIGISPSAIRGSATFPSMPPAAPRPPATAARWPWRWDRAPARSTMWRAR